MKLHSKILLLTTRPCSWEESTETHVYIQKLTSFYLQLLLVCFFYTIIPYDLRWPLWPTKDHRGYDSTSLLSFRRKKQDWVLGMFVWWTIKRKTCIQSGSKESVVINKEGLFYADHRAWNVGDDAFNREYVGQVWPESFAYRSIESCNSSLR